MMGLVERGRSVGVQGVHCGGGDWGEGSGRRMDCSDVSIDGY
jgi:hypothetical protein